MDGAIIHKDGKIEDDVNHMIRASGWSGEVYQWYCMIVEYLLIEGKFLWDCYKTRYAHIYMLTPTIQNDPIALTTKPIILLDYVGTCFMFHSCSFVLM